MKKYHFLFFIFALFILSIGVYGCRQDKTEASIEIGIAAFSVDGGIPSREQILAFEKKLGSKIDTVNWFMAFNPDINEFPEFPLTELKQKIPLRMIPMLTWEPWGDTKDKQGKLINPLHKINNGDLDYFIRSYAKAIKKYGKTIRLRFGHEMIQDDNPQTSFPDFQWYTWQDRPEDYKKAFIRIHQIFKVENADNVEFVWAVNNEPFYQKVMSKYYPGKEYVDWIGIDGYNWNRQDFDGIFKKIYLNITRHPEIYGDKPVMISEIGAGKAPDDPNPFDKAKWIQDAFKKILSDYPKIKSIYWFNVNKEKDWRLDETPESWQAFKEAVRSQIH